MEDLKLKADMQSSVKSSALLLDVWRLLFKDHIFKNVSVDQKTRPKFFFKTRGRAFETLARSFQTLAQPFEDLRENQKLGREFEALSWEFEKLGCLFVIRCCPNQPR